MATSKASRAKATIPHGRGVLSAGRVKAEGRTSSFFGIATNVPYNPRVRQLKLSVKSFEPTKVIVLNINSRLNHLSSGALSDKAVAAKDMFARYRKAH